MSRASTGTGRNGLGRSRRLVAALLAGLLAVTGLALTPTGVAHAADPEWFGDVTYFSDPTIDGPDGIVAGPDGNLWFTNQANNSISRLTPAGVVTQFTHATISGPASIAEGADGNLWFANRGNDSIGRITPAGVVSNFTDPTINDPLSITTGPDSSLWFTNSPNSGAQTIGKITTAGTVTNFPQAFAYHITAGPDGNLWFTNVGGSIGRMTPDGTVTTFSDPTISIPQEITAGPDGNLWFANMLNDSIGRITPAGVVSNFVIAGMDAPQNITTGPDGNLWWASFGRVGMITTAGVGETVVYHQGSAGGIATGPDGQVWYTNFGGDYIGRVVAVGPKKTAPTKPTNVTATASDGAALVSWEPPASNGGAFINWYEVTAQPGGATCEKSGSQAGSCLVEGLDNGTAYTFTVTAFNSVGTSPASDPAGPVTPEPGPDATGVGLGVGLSAGVTIDPVTGQATVTQRRSEASALSLTASPVCADASTPTAVSVLFNAVTYPMTAAGATWSVTVPPGSSGALLLKVECAGAEPFLVVLGKIVLFDPSGYLTDAVSGDPVAGASVTLYRVPGWTAATTLGAPGANQCESNLSKTPGASWSQPAPTNLGVEADPDSGLIDPELNPFVSTGEGYYGWYVASGCWYVVVEADGYQTLTSPVVGVPTEVTDLDLELTPLGSVSFSDVPPSHPFHTEIMWLASSGITTGFDDGTFRPTNPVTRQALASFLYKYEDQPVAPSGEQHFADVAPGHPFYTAIQWMFEQGLSTGSTNPAGGKPLFKPTDPVLRRALASFMYNYATTPTVGTTQHFADVASGQPFFTAIQWMFESGLSTGSTNPAGGLPLYKPTDAVSRQAIAAFLYRYDTL